MAIGDLASAKRKFTIDDVRAFAALTGDYNPIHLDELFAAQTLFKQRIVHGPLVITLVTTLFATELPGPGTIYLSHDVKYLHPVFINDEITGVVEVTNITEKNHIFVTTTCKNQHGITVLEGIARLKKL